jgi:hypothetical protein
MIFNEALEQRQQYEEGLLKKWDKALNADGGIKDEHMAKTTAILLENYMGHLQSNPSLIAEERISTNNFKGVNLALLGLIRRAIPTLVGAELVGVQAMPTPQSPIFYMAYKRGQAKGSSIAGSELFGYPGTIIDGVLTGEDANITDGGSDPFYSSNQVRYKVLTLSSGKYVSGSMLFGPAINNTAKVLVRATKTFTVNSVTYKKGQTLAHISFASAYTRGTAEHNPTSISAAQIGGEFIVSQTAADQEFYTNWGGPNGQISGTASFSITPADGFTDNAANLEMVAMYEYTQESNSQIPELDMQILQYQISLIRRQLRGKFSLDAAVDAKAYHGISLENELMEMMKLTLTNEINREIVNDLRLMSGKINMNINYGGEPYNTSGNYDDTHRLVLDAINSISAEIYNQTRVGRGNFVVGNPVTLAFLDRVPGFVGSGVDMTSGGLSYAGKQGGRISFYFDPQYPRNELLIGYKGASALDCGYIHAPYLPITATPTLYNQETGDPSKIFYTRYGKTYRDIDPDKNGAASNAIYRGEYFYGKLLLNDFPTFNTLAQ